MAEYVIYWTFPSAEAATAAWYAELPPAYEPTGEPIAEHVVIPGMRTDQPTYRVTGQYEVKGAA
jgi:hypothetical protein